jgi:hypothetical protein
MERNENADREDALLDELRRVVQQVDPVPEHVVAAARASLSWRTFDDDLAELLHDSSTESSVSGMRADDRGRVLSFEGEHLALEMEVSGTGSERALAGQVTPAGPGRVEVRHRDGVQTVEVDERGRFSAAEVPAGTVSLRFHAGAAGQSRSLTTPWLPI